MKSNVAFANELISAFKKAKTIRNHLVIEVKKPLNTLKYLNRIDKTNNAILAIRVNGNTAVVSIIFCYK